MSFSKIIPLLFLSVSIFGCGLKVGEKTPERAALSLDRNNYSCVGQIAQQVNSYIDDKLSEDEINVFLRCLQKSFVNFAQLTHGRETDNYHPNEIRRFIEKYFLKDKLISDKLLHEFMVIKQVFVGGKSDRISRADLGLAVQILEDIRVEAIRMKPHIKIMNSSILRRQPPENLGDKLSLAQEALNSSILTFTKRLAHSKKEYTFHNLDLFMNEFRSFVDWDQQFPDSKPVAHWIEFFKVFKQLNVSGDEHGIAINEWGPMIRSFWRWYMIFLQFEVGVRNHKFMSGIGFENTRFLAQEGFRLLEDSIRAQPSLVVSFTQLDRLISACKGMGWFPDRLRVASVQQVVRGLLNRVFGDPEVAPEKRQSGGLTLFTLSNISSEFYKWVYIQMKLNRSFPLVHDNEKRVPSLLPISLTSTVGQVVRENQDSNWDEFLSVVKIMRPLFSKENSHVFLSHQSQLKSFGIEHGLDNLSMINLLRSITNLLYRGYADSPVAKWDSPLTEQQLQKFYLDVRDFGIDLEFIDSRAANAGERSFLEGSIFTYSADGIHEDSQGRPYMQLTEAIELIAFLYAGGNLGNDLYKNLVGDETAVPAIIGLCDRGPTLDINRRFKVSRSCVRKHFTDLLLKRIDNMPELKAYLKALPAKDREGYAQILMETAFSPAHSDKEWMELAEFSTMAVVIHYAEAVMTRYDENHDGILDQDEVDLAAPTFSGLIDKVARKLGMGELWDWQKVAALKYIVAFREIPTTTWSKTDLFVRDWVVGFSIQSDRMSLAQVFRTIIQKVVAPPESRPPQVKAKKLCYRCPVIKTSTKAN